jgi:hypothetical protein
MTASTQSLQVLGLTPNQDYIIEVFATKTDASGQVHISPYSPRLQISTPSLSGSGSNLSTTNYGTDIKLGGGSIYAGTITNTGVFDPLYGSSNNLPVSLTSSQSGIVLNQYGLAGYSSGTPEFYIDSRSGKAYFAGTITAPSIQSSNYSASTASSEPKYSQAGTLIDLSKGAISSQSFRIDASGNAYFKGNVDSNATIGGTLASTLISNASLGAIAYGPALSAIQASTTFKATNNNVVAISTAGITINTNGTGSGGAEGSGTRVEFNSNGLYGFSGTTQTFGISASTGNAYFSGSIGASTVTGSTFTSPNYAVSGSGSGFAITSAGTSDIMYFSYNTTNVASIIVSANGGITLGSNAQSTSIQIGSSPSSVATVINGVPSYGGSHGHLRNIWMSTSSVAPTTGSDATKTVGNMNAVASAGDIYLVFA